MSEKSFANRRDLLAFAGAAAVSGLGISAASAAQKESTKKGATIAPAASISRGEYAKRLDKARAEMRKAGVQALLVESGSSLVYFTGIRWWRSERLTAALIPADGDICIVTPAFEEPSIQEMLMVGGEVRVWNEDESPYALLADFIKSKKIADGRLAIEETVRYFAVDGLRNAAPNVIPVNGAAIVNGCRMIKSPAEIALMQRATDIVIAAYREIPEKVEAGMEGADIFAIMSKAIAAHGGENPSGGVQINEGSALPHGSKERQVLREGSVALMDCGCTIDGYHADISRTFVFGEPDKTQRRIFSEVRKGQDAAMEAAQIGVSAGIVDDKVRSLYESLGYGPGYKLPGLSHRTGHGIGLDVHEPVNLVHGETTKLAAGMCFSNEPGIYVPGSFGIRIEDCFYMTPKGPHYFSEPPKSLDAPFG